MHSEITHSGMQMFGHYEQDILQTCREDIAIVDFPNDQERLTTHGELDRLIEQMSAFYEHLGCQPGDRVAIVMPNGLEMVQSIFGAMRAGFVPIPINVHFGPDVLRKILVDSAVRVICCDSSANPHIIAAGLAESIENIYDVNGDNRVRQFSETAHAPPRPKSARLRPQNDEDELIILYTSGSTGTPKGVVLTVGAQRWFQSVEWMLSTEPSPMTPGTALVAAPLFHKSGMLRIKALLAYGGSVVLLKRFNQIQFLDCIERYKVTHAAATPTMYQLMMDEIDRGKTCQLSSLKFLRIGGAACPAELEEEIADVFGCKVFQIYGLTEGSPIIFGPPRDGRPLRAGSIGVPLPGVEVRLSQSGDNNDENEGELWVKSPGILKHYLNLPELTNERIVDGWVNTRDILARDTDGYWYFRGRADEMFTCSGENIYPTEVERILLSHKDILFACVLPRPHQFKGNVPIAAVVTREGIPLTTDEIKAFFIENGPAYSHPREIYRFDEMPMQGPNKIDRHRVKALIADIDGVPA